MLNKILKAYRDGGIRTVVFRSYRYLLMEVASENTYNSYKRFLRSILPKKKVNYNGVIAKDGRKFNLILPERNDDDPEYERGLVKALRKNVSEEDKVVVIGGGRGVTSIIAKRKAGRDGKVITFEPMSNLCEQIEENAEINRVELDVRNKFVGEIVEDGKEFNERKKIAPTQLPECDVLEIDSEGAETEILENMSIRPRVVIVESHGMLGSPTSKVKKILKDKNYEIENVELAENTDKIARDADLRAITAKYKRS